MARKQPRGVQDGRLWVWLSGLSLLLILAMAAVLGLLIVANSLRALWPAQVLQITLRDGTAFLGVAVGDDIAPDGGARRQFKVANRELNAGADFRWVNEADIRDVSVPTEAVVLKRLENGDFFGLPSAGESAERFQARLRDSQARWRRDVEPVQDRLIVLGEEWRRVNLAALRAEYLLRHATSEAERTRREAELSARRAEEDELKATSEGLMAELQRLREPFLAETAAFILPGGAEATLPLSKILDASWPNNLGLSGKLFLFFQNAWNLLVQNPREANTEGGLYPAIFGTAILVFLMAVFAFPLGVAAGVYLREYARDSLFSRFARIAVGNLAGVPSIVYGIFGLGFFVYGLGGTLDGLLYPERVEAGITTFGSGGIIWSSLTLGLLTLPVVIVATEEALTTIPSDVRQGSLALGATRFQTLWRVVLPMASPGILTGFILAMARAAGEVAPLMITGVVKSAETLPLDSIWPFIHLERKFMHLGFHIYDMGFQSPNVEAAKPLVYLTALVLLVLVFVLNFAAFKLRQRMREKYAIRSF